MRRKNNNIQKNKKQKLWNIKVRSMRKILKENYKKRKSLKSKNKKNKSF